MSRNNLANLFRAAGLVVIELGGWQGRANEPGPFTPVGIILHHDGMGLGWNSNPNDDLNVPKNMAKPGSYGSQLWVQDTGAVAIISAGRMPHAGRGSGYKKILANQGNRLAWGIETDHTYGNLWPQVQLDSIDTVCRVLIRIDNLDPVTCCGHKEYAPGRKADPERLDLNAWRTRIATTAKPTVPTPIQGDDDMPTAKEIVDAQMQYKIKVTDTYLASIGRDPNLEISVAQMMANEYQFRSMVARDTLAIAAAARK